MDSAPPRRVPRVAVVIAAVLVFAAWTAVAAFGGPTFGTISEVTNNDQASYLPATAESTKVQKLEKDFYGTDSIPATVLFVRTGGLDAGDTADVRSIADRLGSIDGITTVQGPIPAKDGAAYRHLFTGKYAHRILDGIGHNVPQEAPSQFADAVVEVASWS